MFTFTSKLCQAFFFNEYSESESYVTTDGQPASLSCNKAPFWGLRPDLYYCCGFVDLGRPLWREDGSVVYNCCWPSAAQSFSGPSPVGLVAIFYCLGFETSLFVASYDSQGHGGGIRPRLHTGSEMNRDLDSKLTLERCSAFPVSLIIFICPCCVFWRQCYAVLLASVQLFWAKYSILICSSCQ
jgi:hypothetical protein